MLERETCCGPGRRMTKHTFLQCCQALVLVPPESTSKGACEWFPGTSRNHLLAPPCCGQCLGGSGHAEPVLLLSELQPSGPPARAHLSAGASSLLLTSTCPPGSSADTTLSMEAFPSRLLPTEDPAFTCALQRALPTAQA